jgi:hypothetical protein
MLIVNQDEDKMVATDEKTILATETLVDTSIQLQSLLTRILPVKTSLLFAADD